MDYSEKFKKVNLGYMLPNIFGPLMLMVLGLSASMVLPENVTLIISIVVFFFAILWWSIFEQKLSRKLGKKALGELEKDGFTANYTFNSNGCTVSIDQQRGKVAFVFRWNPTKAYVRQASSLTGVRVDDGCQGSGFMEGSSLVRFMFEVDGKTMKVNTFTSNRRWKMDSEYIKNGVKKAESMANALIAAGAKK